MQLLQPAGVRRFTRIGQLLNACCVVLSSGIKRFPLRGPGRMELTADRRLTVVEIMLL